MSNYPTNLTDKQWQVIQKVIHIQRKSKWDLQEIVNAIFYLTKNGCMWRDLPGEFPPWQTVYWYYQKWIKDGTRENINRSLIVGNRIWNGKKFQPTVAIIDSQSTKNSPTCTSHVGVDGGKLIKGRKRFYITDTLGNLLDCFVVPANRYDGTTAAKYWQRMYNDNELLQNIKLVFADGTFGGTFFNQMQDRYNIDVQIPKVPIAGKGKYKSMKKDGLWKEQSPGLLITEDVPKSMKGRLKILMCKSHDLI